MTTTAETPRRAGAFILSLCAALAAAAGAHAVAKDPTPSLKPPVPLTRDVTAPRLLSESDAEALKTSVDASQSKKFDRARATAGAIGDPAAREAALWAYFNADDPNVDWRALADFIDAHENWPWTSRLRRFAEQRLPDALPDREAMAFFAKHPPLTGEGKLRFARGLLADRERQRATELIRSAWIDHDYSASEEQAILRDYRRRLRADDHVDRADRLLWGRRITATKRMLDLLPSYARPGIEARLALLSGDRNGEALFARLTEQQRLDGGVMHAAVRFARRDDREEEAIRRALSVPTNRTFLRDVDAWWLEKRLLARWALKNGLFYDAYALATSHGLDAEIDGYIDYADAEFFAGWIALRFLDRPRDADLHFQRLEEVVSSPISVSRARYWRGRAADAQGDRAAAEVHYAAAAAYPNTYYGQLAADSIGAISQTAFDIAPTTVSRALSAEFENQPRVRVMMMFGEVEESLYYRVFSHDIARDLIRPEEVRALADLGARYGAPDAGVRAGKYAAADGLFLPDVAYPDVSVPGQAAGFVERALILGLSRQESEFNPRAYSSAGARGPMQLLPSTASLTARKEGFPYRRSWLLDRPEYNFVIGAAHLSHLLDRFDGSYVMVLAAYNAGPHRVYRWIEEYGDPRAKDVDPVDWVELIPFSETRNYVMRVMENMHVYRHRLEIASGADPFDDQGGFKARETMSADLARGGPRGRAGRLAPPSPVLADLAVERSSNGAQPAPPDYDRVRAVIAAVSERRAQLGVDKEAVASLAASDRVGDTRLKTDAPLAYADGEPQLLIDGVDIAVGAAPKADAPKSCRRLGAMPDGAIVCLDGPKPVILCPAPKTEARADDGELTADDLNAAQARTLSSVDDDASEDEKPFTCPKPRES